MCVPAYLVFPFIWIIKLFEFSASLRPSLLYSRQRDTSFCLDFSHFDFFFISYKLDFQQIMPNIFCRLCVFSSVSSFEKFAGLKSLILLEEQHSVGFSCK